MKYKNTDFPTYRKLFNDKSYFKINSLTNFKEIQLIGNIKKAYTFQATQYFDKLKVIEILEKSEIYFVISSYEFINVEQQISEY